MLLPCTTSAYTLANRKSDLKTIAEEKDAAQHKVEAMLSVYQQILPGLLEKLSHMPDPRNPHKIKHKMTMIILYGILMFVYQVPSRRKANQELTTPQLLENLKAVFPEIEDMPHQSTLCRLLETMDVDCIETVYTDLLKQVIRKKKFKNLLHKKRYLVAVDGTQKYLLLTTGHGKSMNPLSTKTLLKNFFKMVVSVPICLSLETPEH